MSADVAQLSVRITADTTEAEQGLDRTSKKVKTTGEGFGGALKRVAEFTGAGLLVDGVTHAVGFLKDNLSDMVSSGMDANRTMDVLAQGLKSTHDASGMTLDSLDKLSTSLMNQTGIDDDSTKAAEQMLLTFTGIGKDAFPAATQAAADMATRMNGGAIPSAQQMQQQALLLGKALNDPAKGMTALTREGVTFSDQQKEQIKQMVAVGDTAGAQKIMLAELSKEFGGSAQAAGQANGGIAILTAQFDNMKQTVGQAIIPVLTKLMQGLTPITSALSDDLPGALALVTPLFNNLWTLLQLVAQVVTHNLQPAITAVQGAFDDLGKSTRGLDFNKIITPVLQLAGILSGLLNDAVLALLPILKQLGTFVATVVAPALAQLGGFILANVVPAIIQLVSWFGQKVMPVLTQVATIVVQNVIPALETIWTSVQQNLIPALENLWNKISPVLIPAFQLMGWILSHIVGPAIGLIINILSHVIDIIADVAGAIIGFIGGALARFGDAWNGLTGIVTRVWDGIKYVVQNDINWFIDRINDVIDLANKIPGVHFGHLGHISFGGGSPGAGGDSTVGTAVNRGDLPHRASGGPISGVFEGAEAGPELLLNRGLYAASPGSYVLNAADTARLFGGNGSGAPQTQHIIIQLDGRTLAEATVKELPNVVRVGTGYRNW